MSEGESLERSCHVRVVPGGRSLRNFQKPVLGFIMKTYSILLADYSENEKLFGASHWLEPIEWRRWNYPIINIATEG